MRALRGRGVMTPDLAQQARALPYCQRQHDRKESGSKHVMLATHKGKSCASQQRRRPQEILTFSRSRRRRTSGPAEFRRSVPKIPRCDRHIAVLAVTSKPEYAEALEVIEVAGIPVRAFAEQKGLSSSNAGVRVFRALSARDRVRPSDRFVQRSFSLCPARMGDIERSEAGGTS
jgi:hypothetical protein